MLYLSDMNTHFEMILDGQHIPIQFGEFSLSLANINYDKLQVFLEDYLRIMIESSYYAHTLSISESSNWSHFKKHKKLFKKAGISPDEISGETIQKIIHMMETPLYDFLDSGYLTNAQLRIVTQLILSEFDSRLRCNTFDWKDEYSYLPDLFAYRELREHLESILLRSDSQFSQEVAEILAQKEISSSIQIDRDGIVRTTFHITDVLSFLLIDLVKYLNSNKTILRCENPDCRRLFYPKSNKNKHYCQLPHRDSKLTCAEIMHRKPRDEFTELARKARGAQKGFVNNAINGSKYEIDIDSLNRIYYQWQDDCNLQVEHFRSIDDVEGFKKWIRDTRLTAKRLEELGIRIRKPKPKNGRG